MLEDGTKKQDGMTPLIQRVSFAPAERFEWGIDQNQRPYEKYEWCESDFFEETGYCHTISEEDFQKELTLAAALFEKAGRTEEAERCREYMHSLPGNKNNAFLKR